MNRGLFKYYETPFFTKRRIPGKEGKNLGKSQLYAAFTLAEVLITIGIIGVVAVIVISQLISNSQETEYKIGKDKVRMSIAEAGRIMSVSGEITGATSAEDFVKNYLSKRLKIAAFCAPADMEKCGMPSGNPTKFKNLYNANLASMPSTWTNITYPYGVTAPPAADPGSATSVTSNPTTSGAFNSSYTFLSADGIAVNLFYNPYCVSTHSERPYYVDSAETYAGDKKRQMSLDTACMAGVYDMNGLKKPNTVGKDIGFFATFYNGVQSTSAAVLPYKEGIDTHSYNWSTADNYCKGIQGWKLPTLDELSALYLGRKITGMPNSIWWWSASSLGGSGYSWAVSFAIGRRNWYTRSTSFAVRCVRD